MNEHTNHCPSGEQEIHSYSTGSTQPPKKRRGILVLLLAAAIFLLSTFSALSFLNIRLTAALARDPAPQIPVAFFPNKGPVPNRLETLPTLAEEAHEWTVLGIRGVAAPEAYRKFYGLPLGICITEILTDSAADSAGLLAGDTLLRIDGHSLCSEEDLTVALNACEAGKPVTFLLFRNQQQLTVTVTP